MPSKPTPRPVIHAADLPALVRGAWSEEEFQRQVIRLAKENGWRVARFRCVRVQRRDGWVYYETPVQEDGKGWPDLVLVRGEKLLAVELKVKKNQPSPEQRAWLDALHAAHITAVVWRPDDYPVIVAVLTAGKGT